ncbi:chorismate mutase [Nostoc sp. 'Peltigera membranacea cyanobiont' 210A]|uniref:chorismate mutase n=1 Tax=Nostoc sp. 'Peltigera membranacea cyanobiont' 210A TaxID=2014529 RepID=UPI001CB92CC3|nr:chorismate mutase [Nostoc sp. 'Peltigera membranacea cyanobiont' 210A]
MGHRYRFGGVGVARRRHRFCNNSIFFGENQFQPTDIISVTFSVTRDFDAIFPDAIARARPGWDNVAMLYVQQMHVEGSLQRCIRFLIHAYLPASASIHHIYLRNAASLRSDWSLPQSLQASQPAMKSKV